jgi:ABC-2 type transport system permease protein
MSFYKLPEEKNMSLNRIKAILIHEVFISKHSFEIFNDIFLYPLFSIIVFGFMTMYLAGSAGKMITDQVLAGMIFWQVVNIAQYSIGVGCLWDVWSRNLTNIFISPIRISEYLLSFGITGTIKSFIVLILSGILSQVVFHSNIFSMGALNMFLIFVNLVVFGFSFGVIMLGLIVRFGTKVAAFAWGLINLFQPFMAVIYPVAILPQPFRNLAYLLAPTHAFEAMRKSLVGQNIFPDITYAVLLNLFFLIGALMFFRFMFTKSKSIGAFARLEG